MTPWYKQKTTLAAISAILLAWGAYLSPDPATHISLLQAGFGTITALGGIFMRQAVEKSAAPVSVSINGVPTTTVLDKVEPSGLQDVMGK